MDPTVFARQVVWLIKGMEHHWLITAHEPAAGWQRKLVKALQRAWDRKMRGGMGGRGRRVNMIE